MVLNGVEIGLKMTRNSTVRFLETGDTSWLVTEGTLDPDSP